MADKSKKGKDSKKPEAASSKRSAAPKKTGRTSTSSKTKAMPKKTADKVAKSKPAAEPKKTAQTVAKAKTAATKAKSPKKEPKPPEKVMKELEKLAQKHGGQANVPAKSAPKVNVSKSGDTKVAPPKNGTLKEVTVKYRYD